VKILWFEKIKKKYFLKQKQLTKMINAEINLLLRLRHPNIIQFREAVFAQEKERIFIILEYCARGSLLNILNARITVPDEEWHLEVQGYFAQMVEALSFSTPPPTQSTRVESSTATSSPRTCW
jgi:serine/threonine protein kinase